MNCVLVNIMINYCRVMIISMIMTLMIMIILMENVMNDIANENDSEDDDECDDNDDGDLLSSFSPRLLLLLEVNKEKLLVYFMYIRLYFV